MKTNNHLHMRRQTPFVSTILLVLALLLQACGGGTATSAVQPTSSSAQPTAAPVQPTSAPAQPNTTSAVAQPTQPVAATATSASQASTQRSGNLRVALQAITQTDPAFISTDSEVLVANAVYDYLVDVDPKNKIVPRLATDWTISPDGLTYVFNLAKGVTFHDGSPFSAKDVVWTFNRLRDPTLQTPTVDLYSNIDSIEATGDLQVTFKLKQPNPFFLFDLSDNHALILKADTKDPTDFNGTGPFIVDKYSPEDRITFKANPNYFIPGEPKLAGFELIFFSDDTAAVDALKSGQIDLSMRMSSALFESLKNQPNIQTIDIPTNGFDLVRLRADQPPGNDPKVIQAFKLATDREAIFKLVQQGYGAVGRDSPIGPLYTQYYTEDTPIPPRNVQKAKDLLAQAGYPNGLKLDMHVPDTGNRPNLAAALKSQWAEAGIDVNVIVEPESVYYGDNGWLSVDLGITGWGSRPYPQFYLDTMLECGAKWNEAHWCDSEFDQLAKTAGTTMDEQTRVQAYHQIQKILIERGPIIVPYFFAQFAAINTKFQGFELKAFAGRTDFRTVSVAQ